MSWTQVLGGLGKDPVGLVGPVEKCVCVCRHASVCWIISLRKRAIDLLFASCCCTCFLASKYIFHIMAACNHCSLRLGSTCDLLILSNTCEHLVGVGNGFAFSASTFHSRWFCCAFSMS